MDQNRCNRSPRGSVAMVAMVYLVLMSVLAMAMASLATLNVRIAYNQDATERARASAEAGLRWIGWRFHRVSLPQTTTGVIDDAKAKELWPQIKSNVKADLADMNTSVLPSSVLAGIDTTASTPMHIGPVTLPDGSTFDLTATPAPADHPGQSQVVQLKSTGTYGTAKRAMVMEFLIQKTMKYAVVSRTGIQLGKNTVVEGDVYMAAPMKTGQQPVLSISDFRYTSGTTSDGLTTQVQAFQNYLNAKYAGHDNRVPADSTTLTAIRAYDTSLKNVTDFNADGYIDEYDLFLQYFDKGTDHRVQGAQDGKTLTGTEFAQTATLDPNLFYVIDQGIGAPARWYRDTTTNKLVNPDDPDYVFRPGFDDGYLDVQDGHAKIKGHVKFYEKESVLKNNLATNSTLKAVTPTIESMLQGTIISPDGLPPVQFDGGSDTADPALGLSAANFTMGAFLALAGTSAGTAVHPGTVAAPDTSVLYANTTIDATDSNGTATAVTGSNNTPADSASWPAQFIAAGDTSPVWVQVKNANGTNKTDASGRLIKALTQITENVPYGASNPRGTVTRKVFSGVNFKNCIINRGTNALFVNCTFDGVTFVDGDKAMGNDYTTTVLAKGNTLRFESCTFTGPIAQGDKSSTDNSGNKAPAPPNFTLATNNWEFTGATTIDFKLPAKDGSSDSTALANLKEQATMMCPQTNIEMGSFTAPGQAKCSFQGVVVAGVFDVRGVANIDGTIVALDQGRDSVLDTITLGYFGSNDAATSQGEPDPALSKAGGAAYGRIHIRFNPYRTLPDGINLCVSMLPDATTWREVAP